MFILVYATTSFANEGAIKGRQQIFSQNYKIAKAVAVQIKGQKYADAQKSLLEMSENFTEVLDYFPEDSKTGFDTEALPSIWENTDEFTTLMQKASYDLTVLAKKLDNPSGDLIALQKELMWDNCSACHDKFRAEH